MTLALVRYKTKSSSVNGVTTYLARERYEAKTSAPPRLSVMHNDRVDNLAKLLEERCELPHCHYPFPICESKKWHGSKTRIFRGHEEDSQKEKIPGVNSEIGFSSWIQMCPMVQSAEGVVRHQRG